MKSEVESEEERYREREREKYEDKKTTKRIEKWQEEMLKIQSLSLPLFACAPYVRR